MATAQQTPPNPLVAVLGNPANLKAAANAILGLGARGLVLAARLYLGPLAYRAEDLAKTSNLTGAQTGTTTAIGGLSAADLAILALGITKLAFEIGELALHNPDVDGAGALPQFVLDEQGHAPALSLAHVIAAVRWWDDYRATEKKDAVERERIIDVAGAPSASPAAILQAVRTSAYAQSTRYSYSTSTTVSTGVAMTNTTSKGCSSCGGTTRAGAYTSSTQAAAPAAASRLSGSASAAARAPSTSNCGCGCGGSCGCGCRSQPTTRTYDSSKCPMFAISCETKTALRDCVKAAFCDFMRAVADTICPDGRFDSNVFNNPTINKQLVDSVGQLACSFVHCVPDALCGTECNAAPPSDCTPCDYAVEVMR